MTGSLQNGEVNKVLCTELSDVEDMPLSASGRALYALIDDFDSENLPLTRLEAENEVVISHTVTQFGAVHEAG